MSADERAPREGNAGLPARGERPWWRDAVVYQIYPRSFADSDGDGIGDLPGVRAHLDHLEGLGVDALWLSPFYPSPLNDGGYDVADPRGVDPLLGTLEDIAGIVADCHRRGLRVLVDVVPNHFSAEHPWFRAALDTAPGSPEWERFHCVRGRGADGAEPPNNWRSDFGGGAWSPVPGHDGWWYLHLFDTTQPDLNWENAEVRADFEATLRFWFDLGVDGLRIDVAHTLIKAPGYPDAADGLQGPVPGTGTDATPQSDQPRVHEVWRSWRRLADTYTPPRVFVGEAWVSTPEAQAAYTRPDELHTTFNFHFLLAWWDAARIREVVSTSIASAAAVGAPATWVLSNHDVWRPVSRFAPVRSDQSRDLETGRRRALALSLLSLALPGSAYLYQGEELGLEEVLDLPDEARRDPKFLRTGGADLGRDGCRVPMPWSGTEPPFGFSTGTPWLPQPVHWSALTAEAEAADEASTLSTYRHALRVRRGLAALGDGELEWLDGEAEGVIALLRPGSPGVVVLLNTGAGEAVSARPGDVLVESGGVLREDASVLRLPPDSICWLSAT